MQEFSIKSYQSDMSRNSNAFDFRNQFRKENSIQTNLNQAPTYPSPTNTRSIQPGFKSCKGIKDLCTKEL